MTCVRAQRETHCGYFLCTNMVRSEATVVSASLAATSNLFTPIHCNRSHVSTLDQSYGGKQTGSFNCAHSNIYFQIHKSGTQLIAERQALTCPSGLRTFYIIQNDSTTHSKLRNAIGSISVASDVKFETSHRYEPIDRDPGPGLLAFSRLRNPVQFLLNIIINPLNGGIA